MGEILGLGLSHYPGPLVPTRFWPDMLKNRLRGGAFPLELYEDRSRWPAPMREEWGEDGGVSAAAAHQARMMASYAKLREALDAFNPDIVVIWGDDQYENYKLDCVPPFCVGIHDEIVNKPYGGGRMPFKTDENVWGFPLDKTLTLKGHHQAAHALTTHLLTDGFDVSWARTLRDPAGLAHSFANTVLYLDYENAGQTFPYPIVPIHVNCYGNHIIRAGAAGGPPPKDGPKPPPEMAPPGPSPARCFAFGRAVARYFQQSPWRVALVGSSSWSHGNLTGKTSHFYPDAEADQQRLAELKNGDFRKWGEIPLHVIEDAGQHEVLNWVCLAGAMAELNRDAQVLDFAESYLFNSSKCFAIFPSEQGEVAAAA